MLPSRLLVAERFPIAICALSPSSDPSYLAYPSPVPSPSTVSQNPATPTPASTQSQSGDVILFSTRTLTLSNVIRAHKAPISFLALNSTGTLLATASEKGTVIRVWSVPGAEKLYQFRRGTRETRIYSISFNAVSTLLAASSAHDTVHIFKLGVQEKGGRKHGSGAGAGGNGGSPSPAGSLDSREGPSGMEGGYDAFVDGKKKNGYVTGGIGLGGALTRARQVDIARAFAALDTQPDIVGGRLSPQHTDRALGALARLCVPQAPHERRAVCRRAQRVRFPFHVMCAMSRHCRLQDNAACDGGLVGGIFLLVQH